MAHATIDSAWALMPDTSACDVDVARLKPERRFAAWADALNEHYYSLDINKPHGEFAQGRLSTMDIGAIRFGRVASDPVTIHRRRGHISRTNGDYYLLPMPSEGSMVLQQRGNRACITAGDFALVGTNESYICEQHTHGGILALRIPGAILRDRLVDLDDMTARKFGSERPSIALFVDFARSLWLNGKTLGAAETSAAAKMLIDLLCLALSGGDGNIRQAPSARIGHRQRALRLIDACLSDPQLSPSYIARTLKLSERYLQKIFAERQISLSDAIRSRRLAEAKRLLADKSRANLAIASVAYAVGFRDPGYFSRVFAAETGMTPSEFRDNH